MPTDLFDFWAECPTEAHLHPQDAATFGRAGDIGFDLRCLPSNVWGPLRTAPVVLLYLTPGFSPTDVAYADSARGQATYGRRRQGFEPLDSQEEHEAGWRWWTRRTKAFGEPEAIRDKLAILNLGAYHSKRFEDSHALMALPSSRIALDWAQAVLFPSAERGERVVVCLKKPRAWGLTVGMRYPGTLHAPRTNVAGNMAIGEDCDRVVEAIRDALGTA